MRQEDRTRLSYLLTDLCGFAQQEAEARSGYGTRMARDRTHQKMEQIYSLVDSITERAISVPPHAAVDRPREERVALAECVKAIKSGILQEDGSIIQRFGPAFLEYLEGVLA